MFFAEFLTIYKEMFSFFKKMNLHLSMVGSYFYGYKL